MTRRLCALDEIPDGQARGFPAPRGGYIGLFAVRLGDAVRVYVNACPHVGVALDRPPGRFLDEAGTRIICRTHGAQFRPDDGECLAGPCLGRHLERVPAEIRDGAVLVADDAGL